jgi:8-oxo-dGTP pyrophosphatase MutT (NUDIX family)
MNRYVLIFTVFEQIGWPRSPEQILVVEKNKPDWQKGKYNLLGGKIEDGETPKEAAERELKEESGLDAVHTWLMGKMVGDDYEIFCYRITVHDDLLKPRDGETEKVSWQHWDTLLESPKLIHNLKVIIPLMSMGTYDWTITGAEGTNICVSLG